MSLSFLSPEIHAAIQTLNLNLISEIRLRKDKPVILQYEGEYKYLNPFGLSDSPKGALKVEDINKIINSATNGSVYSFAEQMKNGFITVQGGIRIGIAGEYVTESGRVIAVKNLTSLTVRIPHDIRGCANYIVDNLFLDGLHSTLLYSKPGLGKTTMLRDLAISISEMKKYNILVFDERGEIAGIDGYGHGFDLGDRTDIVRCHNKRGAISSAIRAMRPDLIITDELYGDDDISAVKYAIDCGLFVLASTHISNREILKNLPFEFYAELKKIGENPLIYDKNFNSYRRSGADDGARSNAFGQ